MARPQRESPLEGGWEREREDAAIDWLVYELYRLTEEEIRIVEKATR